MQQQSEEQQEGRQPPSVPSYSIAWDPKCPARLNVPTVSVQGNGGDGDGGGVRMNSTLSHGGVGCNEHETSALMHLLDAYETYAQETSSREKSWKSMKKLSRAYRKALRDCLISWEESYAEKQRNNVDATGRDTAEDSAFEKENIELLKNVYAISQLSETFLLVPPPETALDYYDDTFFIPGAVTADTVRYLRYHHLPDPLSVDEPHLVQEVLESTQPDMLDGGTLYWKLVESYVLKGLLTHAWGLLSHHSLFERCFDVSAEKNLHHSITSYDADSREKDREGFMDLRSLLLSAPLPGGRDDTNDMGIDIHPPDDYEQLDNLLEGVPPSAFYLWEASQMTSDGRDYPISYNPKAANTIRQNWLHYVDQLQSVQRLKRRIPQLQSLLAILSGDLRHVVFETWPEALCAELLYVNPSILPNNMHVRADRYIRQYQSEPDTFEEVIVSVMKGNAGSVIQVIHTLGGGSGAALPATMTSLLSNLFADAQLLPLDDCSPFLTEQLLSASFSILSSLSPNHCDIAVRLATRLLIPYAKPGGDVRVVAAVAENLEHHTPQSDAEVRTLLSLCRPLIQQKSVRVLDGCISLVLCRYRHYLKDGRPGGAVHWLLVGIELEAIMFHESNGNNGSDGDGGGGGGGDDDGDDQELETFQLLQASSVCYRHLATWCNETACVLLQSLLNSEDKSDDNEHVVSHLYATGEQIISSLKDDSLKHYAANIPEVKFLTLSVGIFHAISQTKDYSMAAKNIMLCLKEQDIHEADGIVCCLAPQSMHWDLLRLAQFILESSEMMQQKHTTQPPFDVRGMQVLLQQLMLVNECREVQRLQPFQEERDLRSMRLAFGRGLMRAFVAENTNKKFDGRKESEIPRIETIRSIHLSSHSVETQHKVVEKMLDI